MEKEFNLFGGLIKFRYVTAKDDEVIKLSDEELDLLKEEYKEKKEEVKVMKKIIDENTPEEDKPKKKENILSNEDIPFEIRMKHIIKAYKKDQEKWGKLVVYAKHLEEEVIRLKDLLIANGYTDSGNKEDANTAKVIKEQKEVIDKLKTKLKELKELKDASDKIKNLENQVLNFPLRVYKARCFKEIIHDQKKYINELQTLLDEHGITYYPRIPVYDLEKEGVDVVVNDSLSYIKTNKVLFEKLINEWESK